MPHCLIVDDNPNNRIVASFIFEDIGLEAIEMASGREALDYVKSGKPVDVILLDWMMPDLDGLGFLAEFSTLDCDAKVVMCSAKDAKTYKVEALDQGANAYLQKPITLAGAEEVMRELGVLT